MQCGQNGVFMKVQCYIANYEHVGKVCWGNETMRKLFATEAERLEKYPSAKYGWDNEAYTYDNLTEEDPALLQTMQEMLKKYPDRIQVGTVSYGQPLSYYINGESNVRQLVEGIRTDLEYFGVRPWVYIMSEHGMHAQIPQLIAQAGFRGAIMRTSFCMYGTNPEYPASCINWKGLDGKAAIPTIPTYPGEQCHCAVNGYTHDRRTMEFAFFGANTLDNKIIMDYPADAPWGDLTEFCERFGGRIKNLIAFRADDPRQPEEFLARYDGCEAYPWVLDTQILEAAGEPEMDVQSNVNDFHVRMPWGLCGNWIWEKCREHEARLYTLDLLDALSAVGGQKPHTAGLREAWKMLLVCQHHDVQIVGLEKDAKNLFSRGERAMEAVEAELQGEARTWSFNPLPWKRADEDCQDALSASVISGTTASQCEISGQFLNTPFYKVTLSKFGGFSGFLDKRTGKEIFLPNRRSGILAGNIGGIPFVEEGSWTWTTGKNCMLLTDSGKIGNIPYTLQWTFYDSHPRVDCIVHVQMNNQYVGRRCSDPNDAFAAFQHEEKLRLKFYPNLPDDAMGWRDQPFAAAQTNRQSIECNHWAAISDGNDGFALFNHGVQCAVRELDGALSAPVAFSMHYVWNHLKSQDLYQDAEIFKRQKGESAEELVSEYFLDGTYRTKFAFLPFSGSWKQAALHRRALEFCYPCVALSEQCAKQIQKLQFHINLSDNLFLSSVYYAKDSLYLRLYEMNGENGTASVCLRGKEVLLEPVDFFENATGDPSAVRVLGPHQVRTFRVLD